MLIISSVKLLSYLSGHHCEHLGVGLKQT